MLHQRDTMWEGNRATKDGFEKTVVFAHGSSMGLAKMSGP
jgi:hypothetical protein